MTREEAEKYMKSKMCNTCGVYLGGGKCLDNCKVIEAIKALEQEPTYTSQIAQKAYEDGKKDGYVQVKLEQESTTKNDLGVDCIDRQATLDAIIKKLGIKNEAYLLEAERVIYQQILAMPSVTPQEPRRGHWIECMPGGAEEWCYKCSECDFWKYKKTINLSKFKFCPNCGSRNEVEK